MVARQAVNLKVTGSNPVRGAVPSSAYQVELFNFRSLSFTVKL